MDEHNHDRTPAGADAAEPHERRLDGREGARQRRIWLIVALVAAVVAGLLLASSVWTGSWGGNDQQETAKLDERAIAPEKECARQSTYDAIKREIFRRAAQIRGSDEAAYAKLADFSLLRVQSPILRGVDEGLGRISCSGIAVLQLPPNVSVASGARTLSSPLDYGVQPAADGTGNVVMLGSVDAFTVPLATIGRGTGPVPLEPLLPPDLEPVTTLEEPIEIEPAPQPDDSGNAEAPRPLPAPQPQPQPPQASSSNPSFNCRLARTRGELAVCRSEGLAALDRQMASQFVSAMNRAEPQQRRLLQSTRSRFLAFRDNCRNDACIADAYRGRMREIRDIMANRWQPPR